VLSVQYAEIARMADALTELPLALSTRSHVLRLASDLTAATSLTNAGQAVTEATWLNLAPSAWAML